MGDCFACLVWNCRHLQFGFIELVSLGAQARLRPANGLNHLHSCHVSSCNMHKPAILITKKYFALVFTLNPSFSEQHCQCCLPCHFGWKLLSLLCIGYQIENVNYFRVIWKSWLRFLSSYFRRVCKTHVSERFGETTISKTISLIMLSNMRSCLLYMVFINKDFANKTINEYRQFIISCKIIVMLFTSLFSNNFRTCHIVDTENV